jgi:hypothetical protein
MKKKLDEQILAHLLLGKKSDYMLEVGISSTRHTADFWGLTQ